MTTHCILDAQNTVVNIVTVACDVLTPAQVSDRLASHDAATAAHAVAVQAWDATNAAFMGQYMAWQADVAAWDADESENKPARPAEPINTTGPKPDAPQLVAFWGLPDGCHVGPDGGHIGQIWDGAAYTDPPPPIVIVTADQVRAECTRRVLGAIGNKRGSLNSYVGRLNGKVSISIMQGQPINVALTAEELADVQLLWAIDEWEGAMIVVRETLAADPSATAFDDATWPPKPAGLTPEWLAGF